MVGSSKNCLKCCNQRAPTAPSTVRWSQLNVTEMKSLCLNPFSESLSGIILCCVPPTANIHDCGGLITAQKCVTPENSKLCQWIWYSVVRLVGLICIQTYRTFLSSKPWWYHLGIHVVAIYHRVLLLQVLWLLYWCQLILCGQLEQQLV